MLESTPFHYLVNEDRENFIEKFRTEDEYLLVNARATMNRLERHLSDNELYRIRFLMTALVRDFKLPPVRYTTAIALVLYHYIGLNNPDIPELDKHIVDAELGLLIKHLQVGDGFDDYETEQDRFDRDSVMVLEKWDEYIQNPSEFSL